MFGYRVSKKVADKTS